LILNLKRRNVFRRFLSVKISRLIRFPNNIKFYVTIYRKIKYNYFRISSKVGEVIDKAEAININNSSII
jgi:hypothetical protein